MKFSIKSAARRFGADTEGHIGVLFALMALPLLICISASLDYSHAVAQNDELKNALDAAVLAAVNKNSLTPTQREAYAKEYFLDNYESPTPVKLHAVATEDRVDLSASTSAELSIGKAVGLSEIQISSQSAAEVSSSSVVCILALDPSADNAIEFKDNAKFEAPACSVQTNSKSLKALTAVSGTSVSGKSFCSAGGSEGTFTGTLKNECKEVEDPFQSWKMPIDLSICKPINTVKNTATLTPGNYCNGLKLDGANVVFEPGVYHIWGELLFTSFTVAKGDRVTFLLRGDSGSLKIDNDAIIKLRAPSLGPTSGLVFWQNPSNDPLKEISTLDLGWLGLFGKSEISASGDISITGTGYFPSQEVQFISDKNVNSSAPATSFVANRFVFGGQSNTTIRVNHELGGIPPLVPRSDDGSRLIK